MAAPERLAFVSQWRDPVQNVVWTYQLMYFPASNEVELFDIKNRRTFLKKTKLEGLKREFFFVGGKVTLFGRQLDITDYGDAYTQKVLAGAQQRTLAIVKPDAMAHLSSIIQAAYDAGFLISKMRICQLSKAEAASFYAVHQGKPFYDALTDFMSSGKVAAMELVAPDAIAKWRGLIGPTDTAQESEFFFQPRRPGTCSAASGTTLCIVKPHVLANKHLAPVLAEVTAAFEVQCGELFNVDKRCAAEFYEVYRGVVAASEYSGMVDELTSGPCLVLEIRRPDGGDCVEPFRQLCGPADPEVAAALRPHSLRARFGVDKNRNAVHCTDLPEDAPLEVNYFFRILPQCGG